MHDYEQTMAARHDAGLVHMAMMPDPPPALQQWAALMTRRYGNTVQVGNAGKALHAVEEGTIDLSAYTKEWLHALLIVMWGEAVESWPATWTPDLLDCATSWATGRTPRGVVYPATD